VSSLAFLASGRRVRSTLSFLFHVSAAAYVSITASALMVVIYVILFLSLSGALERITNRTNSSNGFGSSGGKSSADLPSSVTRGRQVRKVARKMLL